jgi:hypothetical protein
MKTPNPKLDQTPELARQIIELYAEELADVSFPDIDLAKLRSAQNELHAAQLEFERIEAELAQARAERDRQSDALGTKAERALAYARVFAQGDPSLAPRIAEIGRKKLPNPEESPNKPAKPRGRKPKADSANELFQAGPVEAPERERDHEDEDVAAE